jgi:1-acyl-sn-glycerol-3-phosphate acyltransferase
MSDGSDVSTAVTVCSLDDAAASPTRYKRPWFLSLVRGYARRAIARRFDGLFVDGLAETARLVGDRPVLFCANHVSWWDAFVLVLLDEALGADGYALMDDANLARLPFFRAVGALPIARKNGGATARRQLDDAVRTLDRPGRALWIFPQGRQRAAHLRPLGFKHGLRLIAGRAQQAGAVVVPVGLAFPWRQAPAPSVVVRFGAPVDPATTARDELTAHVEARVATLLDEIDAVVDAGAPDGGDPPASSLGHALVAPRVANAEHGLGSRLLGRLLARPR